MPTRVRRTANSSSKPRPIITQGTKLSRIVKLGKSIPAEATATARPSLKAISVEGLPPGRALPVRYSRIRLARIKPFKPPRIAPRIAPIGVTL